MIIKLFGGVIASRFILRIYIAKASGEKIICTKIYIFLYSRREHVRECNCEGKNIILNYKIK